jgi:ribosomal protein S26
MIECKKCGGTMQPGKAIEQTLTGIPDFVGDKYAVTVSPGGPGELIDCIKCVECGYSVTKDAE